MQPFTFDEKSKRNYNALIFAFSSERLRFLVSLYHTHIFVFSVYFVVDFFYAVYNTKIYNV
ncbi:hypothetical protein HMPREF1254_0899 [Prevotella sp. BV3P1]|nr:hypothetical protein HMPREF1254_0899 [Prevotella sp. BV3P1]